MIASSSLKILTVLSCDLLLLPSSHFCHFNKQWHFCCDFFIQTYAAYLKISGFKIIIFLLTLLIAGITYSL